MISAIGLVRHWFSKHGDIKTNFNVGAVLSTIVTLATATFNPDAFVHPRLTDTEHREGSRLGIDSWADTACAGKHAFVEEFVMGKFITAKGFTQALGQLDNLPMANILYAYDTHDGNVLILEANNCIYLGDQMEDSLANPIQAEEIGVRVDTRPKRYYPDDPMAQTIRFCGGTSLPVLYDGVLPYLPVRRLTKDEIHSCKRLVLSSNYHGTLSHWKGISRGLTCPSPIQLTQISPMLSMISKLTRLELNSCQYIFQLFYPYNQ